ncbi:hypothetical protein ACI65C_004817 [Semiaphis heraclei]
MCDVKNNQRIVIKFLVKSGEKTAEIFRKLQRVFANDCLLKPRVYEWASRFASGRESTQDDARPGAPKIVHTRQNVERLSVLVRTIRLTVRMMSSELSINKETIRQMLHGPYSTMNIRNLSLISGQVTGSSKLKFSDSLFSHDDSRRELRGVDSDSNIGLDKD